MTFEDVKKIVAHEGQAVSKNRSQIIIGDSRDKVKDPFFGSGTVGEVCIMLNRKFHGIEINEDYIAIAQERIKILH